MKQFGAFRLDTANACLSREGEEIALPPRPFAVLRYLVENPARLITHEELLDALWPGVYVQPQVLRTYMLELRRVLGDEVEPRRFIQTVPKRGYRFIAPVSDTDGAPVGQGDAPAPHAAGLVGRDPELALLHAEVQKLASQQRRVLFLTGEAGIGKTALVDAFCRQIAASRQALVARGQCVEGFGATEPWYPVMEALSHLCASPDGEAACQVLARVAPAWLPGAPPAPRQTDGADLRPPARERMPGDLCAALEELASITPLILVLEDLDWADPSTLSLISAIARRRAPAALMLIATCTHRDLDGSQACRRLKQDLLLRQLCSEVTLLPLSRAAVRELLRRRLGQNELPTGLTGFLHQHSEGNPLFAMAILDHLIAQRRLVNRAGQWQQSEPLEDREAGLPEGLAQMVELEMQRLTPREQSLLEAGSLMGIAFPAWAVATALGEDPPPVEEECEDLARRVTFIARGGQDELPDGSRSAFYVFSHGVYREVLYRRQPDTRRAARHLRIADRLATLFAGREADVAREMALHAEAAMEWSRAVRGLREAAAHAVARHAHAEASELLEQALRLTEHLPQTEQAPLHEAVAAELDAARRLIPVRSR